MSHPYREDPSTLPVNEQCKLVIGEAHAEFGAWPACSNTFSAMAHWIETNLLERYDVHAVVHFFSEPMYPHHATCRVHILDHIKQINIKADVQL